MTIMDSTEFHGFLHLGVMAIYVIGAILFMARYITVRSTAAITRRFCTIMYRIFCLIKEDYSQ